MVINNVVHTYTHARARTHTHTHTHHREGADKCHTVSRVTLIMRNNTKYLNLNNASRATVTGGGVEEGKRGERFSCDASLCVCVCVCVLVCVYWTCICAFMRTHVYVHMCPLAQTLTQLTFMRAYTLTHIHSAHALTPSTHAHTHTHTYTHTQ